MTPSTRTLPLVRIGVALVLLAGLLTHDALAHHLLAAEWRDRIAAEMRP